MISVFNLSFVVFVLGSLLAQAQGISEVYRDDFTDNKGHWKVGNWSNGSATIANGIYTIDRIPQSNEWYIETSAFVDYDADYDIEMKVRQISGVTNHGYGIAWGAGDAQNFNGVIVSADGHYKIYTGRAGQQTDVIGWTPIVGIPPLGTWHTIIVRKRGSGMSLLLDCTTIVALRTSPLAVATSVWF